MIAPVPNICSTNHCTYYIHLSYTGHKVSIGIHLSCMDKLSCMVTHIQKIISLPNLDFISPHTCISSSSFDQYPPDSDFKRDEVVCGTHVGHRC